MTAIVGKPVLYAEDVNRELAWRKKQKLEKLELGSNNSRLIFYVGVAWAVGFLGKGVAISVPDSELAKFVYEVAGYGAIIGSGLVFALTGIASDNKVKEFEETPVVKFDGISTQEQMYLALEVENTNLSRLVGKLFSRDKNVQTAPKPKM